jgi:hypothetical protein
LRVLVRPFYPSFLENKLFSYSHGYSDRWMEPYVRWRELAATRGIELATWDTRPLESADVIVFMDLPASRAEMRRQIVHFEEGALRRTSASQRRRAPPHASDSLMSNRFD